MTRFPDTAPASTEELCTVVRDAADRRARLCIAGGGTWLDGGPPMQTDACVSTTALRGVIEYIPGDLVITVQAGTTLAELSDITGEHGQWLALDPYVSTEGLTRATIGATVATASSGPLALGYGRPRDLVLGLGAVSGDGRLLRAGGRVVKNVAGFDLVRLLTGACGTLGIIGEVSLRLHARPACDDTFAVLIPQAASSEQSLAALIERLNSSPILSATSSLAALVLCTGESMGDVTALPKPDGSTAVLVARAVGNTARVSALQRMLGALGDMVPLTTTVWDVLRTFEHGNTTFRLSPGVRRTAAACRSVQEWQQRSGATDLRMLVDPMRGTVRVSCDHGDNRRDDHGAATRAEAGAITADGTLAWPDGAIVERAPGALWATVPALADDDLSRQIRRRFDPHGLLNPGRMGGVTTAPLAGDAT